DAPDRHRRTSTPDQLAGSGDCAGGETIHWPSGDRHHPSPCPRECTTVLDAAVVDAWLPGAEHGVHRTAEWHLPQSTGGFRAADAGAGAAPRDRRTRDVFGWYTLQFL